MKHVLFAILFSLALPAMAHADLPPHMSGIGMFTWQETTKVNAVTFAEEAKGYDLAFVILKSHDGRTWGTKVNGKFVSAVGPDYIQELHKRDIRTYTYFTARLDSTDALIDQSIAHAEQTLKWGADGVVVDDLGLFGKSRAKWLRLFSGLRAVVDKYPDTILAASAFPHLMRWDDCPWNIAIQYSDYFLPQNYWKLFRDMQPELAIAYGQSNFDALRSYTESACTRNKAACKKTKEPCKLVPVGMSYGKNVNAEQIEKFLTSAQPFYPGVALFRWGTMPKDGWNVVKKKSKVYTHSRTLEQLSTIDIVQNPRKPLVSNPPTKSGGGKKQAGPATKPSGPMRSIKVRY
jgi:hypothetical protein